MRHRYKVRPGYSSQKLLIELTPKEADKAFLGELLAALRGINANVADIGDLWMNDEVILILESDFGPFLISKDIWNFVFVMAPDNQPVIPKIDEALAKSNLFQKEPVDHKNYR
jgi:hypothetical protein